VPASPGEATAATSNDARNDTPSDTQ